MDNLEKEKLIEERTEWLFASQICKTREEANKQAIKEFYDYNEISKLARMFDIEF
jgi:hypothetical protein